MDIESGSSESGMEHNSTCSVFSVIITLTDDGLDHLCLVCFVLIYYYYYYYFVIGPSLMFPEFVSDLRYVVVF